MLVELCIKNENGCSTRLVSITEPLSSDKIKSAFDEWLGDSTNVTNMSWSQAYDEDLNILEV